MRSLYLLPCLLAACGGTESKNSPFGPTTLFAVVNPPANDANTVTVPASFGTARGGVGIVVQPGSSTMTDATGLAVIDHGLTPGNVSLIVGGGPSIPAAIASAGNVYDFAIAYDGKNAEFYPGFPIDYGVGGDVVDIASSADPSVALGTANTIVFFEDGTHTGNLSIAGDNVILFGEGFPKTSVLIDGNVEVRGTAVRLRNVTITGTLTAFGNQFGMSFSAVHGSAQLNGQGISFLRNTFCGGANVPSSNAALFDNAGLPPLASPGAPVYP